MSYPQEWVGSENEISGIAIFKINGKLVRLNLQKFSDMQEISNALDVAFQMGRDSAKSVLLSGIEGAVEKFRRDFE